MNNTQRYLGIVIILLIIVSIEFYYYYTDPYRVFLEPYEDIPEIKFDKLEKKNSILLLHSGKINIDIKKFSENVKAYANKHKLDYYNASQSSDVNLWQTVYSLFKKYKYEYIWVVPNNAYIHNKDKSIHTLINQSGETDLILSRNESDHSAINIDTFIARNSEWTMYKMHQFYYKQQPLQPQDDAIPLSTDTILDQIYTRYMHKNFKEFEEYLDNGIPYMLMNICVYNEHSIMSSRSDFMRYYDRMPSSDKPLESTQVYPWVMVKHSRFTKIDEIDINKIVSEKGDRKIPKIIFQTMETNLTLLNIQSCITQIKSINPDYKYYYFTSRQCREFIKKEFPDVLEYYDLLLPGAYKADLWRYCVLYKYGGFYLDIRMYPYMSFDSIITNNTEFMSCVDISQNMLYQAILGVEPKSQCMRNAIDECVKNIRERNLADSDLAVTGPRVMGIALNKFLKRSEESDLDTVKDERVVLLEWNSKKAPKYLQDNDNIFCCHKYTKLLLESEINEETDYWLMLTGKEHYSILYRNNKVYKDSLFNTMENQNR
jgi:mannosyltransferase OCH1-like enzyme